MLLIKLQMSLIRLQISLVILPDQTVDVTNQTADATYHIYHSSRQDVFFHSNTMLYFPIYFFMETFGRIFATYSIYKQSPINRHT